MFLSDGTEWRTGGKSRHLYVVDDDAEARRALFLLLSRDGGAHVRTFGCGELFLERLPELDPGCVLLDLHMPGASGFDVVEQLAADSRAWASVILSGAAGVSAAVRLLRAGAVDVLEKPAGNNAIREAVARAFGHLDREAARRARVGDATERLDALSPRERDVLAGLLEGHPNKVIAHQLGLSPRTVEIHRANLMDKLGARSLSDAFRLAMAAGMLRAA